MRSFSSGCETSARTKIARRPSASISATRRAASSSCAVSFDRDVEAPLREGERDAASDAAVAGGAGDERDRHSDHHPDLAVVGHADLVRPQPDVVERDALSRRDVELERVPGARHDLAVPDPGELPVGVGP